MSTREDVLQRMFSRWLPRRSVPQRFQGGSEIVVQTGQDEADALHLIVKHAPKSGYERWLQRLLDDPELSREIPNWPSTYELNQSALKLFSKTRLLKGAKRKRTARWRLRRDVS